MKKPQRIRRETLSVVGGSVATAALVIIFAAGAIVKLVDPSIDIDQLDGLIDSYWPAVATILGLSGAHHVGREHVRRIEKKDADEAGRDDGAGGLHASDEDDAQA